MNYPLISKIIRLLHKSCSLFHAILILVVSVFTTIFLAFAPTPSVFSSRLTPIQFEQSGEIRANCFFSRTWNARIWSVGVPSHFSGEDPGSYPSIPRKYSKAIAAVNRGYGDWYYFEKGWPFCSFRGLVGADRSFFHSIDVPRFSKQTIFEFRLSYEYNGEIKTSDSSMATLVPGVFPTEIIIHFFVLDIIIISLSIFLFKFAIVLYRSWRRSSRGCCWNCGYNTAFVQDRCPECAETVCEYA